jgi:hypothetical protein
MITKYVYFFLVLAFLNLAYAGSQFINESSSVNELKILNNVTGIYKTYSINSQLEAKVLEITRSDAFNSSKMVLIINDPIGERNTVLFELPYMMYKVNKVVFTDIDTIQILFTEENIDNVTEMNQVLKNRIIQVRLSRDSRHNLLSQIEIKEIK